MTKVKASASALATTATAVPAGSESDPEAAAVLTSTKGFPVVRGERRTRLVVLPADGKIPFTAEARKEAARELGRIDYQSKQPGVGGGIRARIVSVDRDRTLRRYGARLRRDRHLGRSSRQ